MRFMYIAVYFEIKIISVERWMFSFYFGNVLYILSTDILIYLQRRKQIKAEERQNNEEMIVGTSFPEKEKGVKKNFREEIR